MLLSTAAAAQETRGRQPQEASPRVPGAFTPPAGMCRLWIEGVPASQQPAPTDCAHAIRNRPPNANVLFGPPLRSESMEMEPFARRSGKLPIRQLAPGSRSSARGREEVRDEPRRDEPRARPTDSTAKPAPRKPERPQ
jgi:hypothetical protein